MLTHNPHIILSVLLIGFVGIVSGEEIKWSDAQRDMDALLTMQSRHPLPAPNSSTISTAQPQAGRLQFIKLNSENQLKTVTVDPKTRQGKAIAKLQAAQVDLKYDRQPIKKVLADLQKKTQVRITADWKALQKQKMKLNRPLTIDMKEVKLLDALNTVMNELTLAQERPLEKPLTLSMDPKGAVVIRPLPVHFDPELGPLDETDPVKARQSSYGGGYGGSRGGGSMMGMAAGGGGGGSDFGSRSGGFGGSRGGFGGGGMMGGGMAGGGMGMGMGGMGMGGGMMGGGGAMAREFQAQELIFLIEMTIKPDSWNLNNNRGGGRNGGRGGMMGGRGGY